MGKIFVPMFTVYHLNYYGINIFLCAGKESDKGVYVYELQTHPYKHDKKYEYIKNDLLQKPRHKCLVCDRTKSNSWWGKNLEVVPIDTSYDFGEGYEASIPITITFDSPLYKKVLETGLYKSYEIKTGTYYFKQLKEEDWRNKCFKKLVIPRRQKGYDGLA